MKNILYLAFFCLSLFSCQTDPASTTSTQSESSDPGTEEASREPATMTVNIDQLRLRDQAGTSGREVSRLPEGSEISTRGVISDSAHTTQLRGVRYREPWLKVNTATGEEGWVYAGGLRLDRQNRIGKMLIDRRLDDFAGVGTAEKVDQYHRDLASITEAADFAKTFRESQVLIGEVNPVLSERILLDNLSADASFPDLQWLRESFPGFTLERVAEATTYHLFHDFRKWYPLAGKTPATTDDEFLDLMVEVYPMDSVAHFFPSWFLQTWDYGGNSLLGKGIHLSVFKKVASLSERSDLFAPELINIKEALMRDIIGNSDMAYEMPKAAILNEIDQILSADLSVLTKQDVLALQQRRKMFEKPEENSIPVNQRAGM